MNTSKLLSLPPELLEVICKHLNVEVLKELRLSCKHLGHALLPKILNPMALNVNMKTFKIEMEKLRAMAFENGRISFAVKELTIRCLMPTFDPSYHPIWNSESDRITKSESEPATLCDAQQAEKDLTQNLLNALTSLKFVRKINWVPHESDTAETQSIVMSALKTLPNLETLKFDALHCKIPLSLNEITGLSAISLETDYNDYFAGILDSLVKMVAISPRLTSIDFLPGEPESSTEMSPTHSLHHLLKHIPKNAAPLLLHHLGMDGCFLRLDNITIPHLKSLKSLRLTNIVDPSALSDYDAKRQKQVGASTEHLWATLVHEGIWLDDIVCENVSPPFLDYLSAYSGLKSLNLVPDKWDKGSVYSDTQAGRFFANTGPLVQHRGTLEELVVRPKNEGRWCFDMKAPPESLAACPRLKKLGLGVLGAQIKCQALVFYGANAMVEEIEAENAIKALIDTVVANLPHLQDLEMSPADSVTRYSPMAGINKQEERGFVHRRMIRAALQYNARLLDQHLPSLAIRLKGAFGSDALFKTTWKVTDAGNDLSLVSVASDK